MMKFNPPIKTIHLYLIKEFAASFLFAIAVFSVLLLLDRIFDLASLFLSKGASFWTIVKLFSFLYPSILPFAIPMSALFGLLLAYGRLSEDNEITAMRANGMGYKTLSVPVLIPIGIISLALIFFNSFGAPLMQSKVKEVFQDILTKVPLSAFSEKTVVKLKDYTFYVNKVDRKNNLLEGVSIYKFDEGADKKKSDKKAQGKRDENISWRISAASASVKIYRGGIGLNLYGGFWQKAGAKDLKNIVHMTFNSYRFYISVFDQAENMESAVQEENSWQILKKIAALKKENKPYGNYAVEFWTRLLFATAPIAFALLAVPLGIMSGKGGKAIGFGISIFVIVLYYMLLIIAMHVSEKNYSYAGFIMWFPNIFISACGTILFAKMVKR